MRWTTPARDFHRRRARPGFPEFDRDAGRYADRLDRRRRGLAELAGAGAAGACGRARSTCGHEALPGELDKVADQARSLREWFRGFVREHKGRPLTAEELLPNWSRSTGCSSATRPSGGSSPATKGSQPSSNFRRCAAGARPNPCSLPIGEALAQLVCTEDFSDVKACEGPACTLMFADHTRGHARRWCSMAICGNRAKQAAHRHRLKEQH